MVQEVQGYQDFHLVQGIQVGHFVQEVQGYQEVHSLQLGHGYPEDQADLNNTNIQFQENNLTSSCLVTAMTLIDYFCQGPPNKSFNNKRFFIAALLLYATTRV